jgi:hypothetical protein
MAPSTNGCTRMSPCTAGIGISKDLLFRGCDVLAAERSREGGRFGLVGRISVLLELPCDQGGGAGGGRDDPAAKQGTPRDGSAAAPPSPPSWRWLHVPRHSRRPRTLTPLADVRMPRLAGETWLLLNKVYAFWATDGSIALIIRSQVILMPTCGKLAGVHFCAGRGTQGGETAFHFLTYVTVRSGRACLMPDSVGDNPADGHRDHWFHPRHLVLSGAAGGGYSILASQSRITAPAGSAPERSALLPFAQDTS